ncbi:hypothetical protein [Streptomyces sp. NRRL F-5135]|uniref:hypothetical protein n=1 Tax=Streptomyces sp. NRRL F-5135 TaxID=1463858 RepID=UPI000562A0BE|nr:hypothetical protein [Streptomyces sp. NRRL F-5135]
MAEVVPYLVATGCLAVVVGFLTWLKGVIRRRGLAGAALQGALASYEEAMRITSHDSHHEIRAQVDRRAPIASPDDPRWTGRERAGYGARPQRSARRRRTRLWRRLRREG